MAKREQSCTDLEKHILDLSEAVSQDTRIWGKNAKDFKQGKITFAHLESDITSNYPAVRKNIEKLNACLMVYQKYLNIETKISGAK
jgi:hypothetical protein